jgi:hypothetical protein
MPLSGLNTIPVRPRGGVKRVEIVPASLWTEGALPFAAAWAFREDRAWYSEESVGGHKPFRLVRHTLVMEFPAAEKSRMAVKELSACNQEGVVAMVTMASGEVIVAGRSSRFGTGYPLRLVKTESASGRTPADFPTITVTLESIDAEISNPIQL